MIVEVARDLKQSGSEKEMDKQQAENQKRNDRIREEVASY